MSDRAFAINTDGAFFTVQRLAPLVAFDATFTTGTRITVDGGLGSAIPTRRDKRCLGLGMAGTVAA